MKKLILFVHGLGGSDETWGEFQIFIEKDTSFEHLDVAFYGYRSNILRAKNMVGLFSKLLSIISKR